MRRRCECCGAPDEELLTSVEAAEILGCSRATIYNLVRRGRLREATTPMSHRRFWRADVLALLEGAGGADGPLG